MPPTRHYSFSRTRWLRDTLRANLHGRRRCAFAATADSTGCSVVSIPRTADDARRGLIVIAGIIGRARGIFRGSRRFTDSQVRGFFVLGRIAAAMGCSCSLSC